MEKTQRINVTPSSMQDFDMVKTLSDLTGATWSQIGARAINDWLKVNFIKEVERHQKINQIIDDVNDEEIDHPLWRGLKKNGGLEDV
tara:strand:+ start:318 stop:578 length:261 start_codon:yes stop_codon:yes gene_type:complete